MELSEAKPKLRVAFLPYHARGDITHPDVEFGLISSWNHKYIFVKFGDRHNGVPCNPEDLRILK